MLVAQLGVGMVKNKNVAGGDFSAAIHLLPAVGLRRRNENCIRGEGDLFRRSIPGRIYHDNLRAIVDLAQRGQELRQIFHIVPAGNDDAELEATAAWLVHSFFRSRLRARSRIFLSLSVKLPMPDLEILSRIGSTEAITSSGSTTRRGLAFCTICSFGFGRVKFFR